jgi:hypothetical protein
MSSDPLSHIRRRTLVICFLTVASAFSCGTNSVQADSEGRGFKITSVAPSIIYPEIRAGMAKLSSVTLLSDEFGAATSPSVIVFLSQKKLIPIAGAPPERPQAHGSYTATDPKTGEFDLWVPWPDYRGKVQA